MSGIYSQNMVFENSFFIYLKYLLNIYWISILGWDYKWRKNIFGNKQCKLSSANVFPEN